MAEHVLLGTAMNEAVATLDLDQLREAGLPVVVRQPLYPYPHAGAPHEIWLTEAELLGDPEVEEVVRQVLHSPEAADDLTSKPFNLRFLLRTLIIAAVAIAVLAVTWAFFFAWPRPLPYRFLEGGAAVKPATEERLYLRERDWLRNAYVVRGDHTEVVRSARKELQPRGFRYGVFENGSGFSKDGETLIISMGNEPGTDIPGRHAQEQVVTWAYRPTLAERVGAWLGR